MGLLFQPVYLPEAVLQECKSERLKNAISQPFFIPYAVKNPLKIGLGAGERDAISAAIELGVALILTDDDAAFKKAMKLGLVPLRFVDFIAIAKRAGHITSAKAVLDRMIAEGEGIRRGTYLATLGKCGESQSDLD